ncbi:MAG TPA: hypothetical protein VG892_11890 [Terriglobales bacterium]|nr:hypothetical protein [Terriglobales bacterium]
MADPAEQLQRIYMAGFEIETFEMLPGAVGVIKEGFMAVLRPTASGLSMIGSPGWRMGEIMGVLVEKEGRQVFQSKSEVVEANPERLEALKKFREELAEILAVPQ